MKALAEFAGGPLDGQTMWIDHGAPIHVPQQVPVSIGAEADDLALPLRSLVYERVGRRYDLTTGIPLDTPTGEPVYLYRLEHT